MKTEILQHLPPDFPWRNDLHYFDSLGSTNTYAKELAFQGASHGTVVIAGTQTAGRGRMGRSFHSPQGNGIYLSVILRPDCSASMLMHLTCAVGVAMCDAVEEVTGLRPGIKWINDLVWAGKKLGGILTELKVTADGFVDYAVVGVGINCNQTAGDFPDALKAIATSLSLATGKPVPCPKLTASMIQHLHKMDTSLLMHKQTIMEQYCRDCVTLEKEVTLHTAQGSQTVYAYGVDNNGGLLVRYPDGRCESVSSGEVSVRGMYGYT